MTDGRTTALLYREPLSDRRGTLLTTTVRIASIPVFRAAHAGDKEAARLFMSAYWPFVSEFAAHVAYSLRDLSWRLPRRRFGLLRCWGYSRCVQRQLRRMSDEEGEHSDLWRLGGRQLGLSLEPVDLEANGDKTPLLKILYDSKEWRLFTVLAAAEYAAEALAAYLCNSPAFNQLFDDGRWLWGEAHLMLHNGPSHLDIDEDLVRAFHPSEEIAVVRDDFLATLAAAHDSFAAVVAQ